MQFCSITYKGDTMFKRTKHHRRALGIIILVLVLSTVLYAAVSYGQLYPAIGSMLYPTNHAHEILNSTNHHVNTSRNGVGTHPDGKGIIFANRTANTYPNESGTYPNYAPKRDNGNGTMISIIGSNNRSGQASMCAAPGCSRIVFNRTVFLQNAKVISESTYLKGYDYLVLKTVKILYSNYTFNISQLSYVRLNAESSLSNSSIIILNETPSANTATKTTRDVVEIGGTNATDSIVYPKGELELSAGNMNISDPIALQIELNITPVT